MVHKLFLFRWQITLTFLSLVLSSCQTMLPATEKGFYCPEKEMAYVPAGWFLMGDNQGKRANQPQRRVFLDDYCIQTTEVTRSKFILYLEAKGYQPDDWQPNYSGEEGNLPITGVPWREADAYCKMLGMHLPSEAQWEKAARGTDGRRYPWGDKWESNAANTKESGNQSVIAVGSLSNGSSPYGVLDMSGNAIEWVTDYFDPLYYQFAPNHNPLGPQIVMDHVLRGGSYDSSSDQATTYFRDSSHSVLPNPRVGFRCAYTPME